MFLLRDVGPDDLDDLAAVAVHLDSGNLPDQRATLGRIIAPSVGSFSCGLPRARADGPTLLWASLGRGSTGTSSEAGPRLWQQNKEFIRALFPQDPLYATLLPARVQELIGEVGRETKGVERMLREIGFEY